LLLWSGLCFLGLTISNGLLFVDLVIFSTSLDLYVLRLCVAAGAMLLLVFGLMTLAALALLFVPTETIGQPIFADLVEFNMPKALLVCAAVGLAAGLVGAGGAFLLVPLLMAVVGLPIRVTIGSSLAITALAATAGVIGKVVTGQVPLFPSLAVVLGAMPGARLGAMTSRRLTGSGLKRVLFIVILASAVRVWWDLLGRLME